MAKIRGTSQNDVLRGGSRNDSIFGLAGNDTLNGGVGDDTLNGGRGNDVLKGGSGHNVLNGGSGKDRLIGGSTTSFTTVGDFLNGGSGADRMEGRGGDDTYIVDNLRDRIIENSDPNIGGFDLVRSRLSIDLKLATFGAGNVEFAELLGTSNSFAKGTDGFNTLTGNVGNNLIQGFGGTDQLFGLAGDDVLEGGNDDSADILDGGLGADLMKGEGNGSDVYIVDNIGDRVIDFGGANDEIHIEGNASSLTTINIMNTLSLDPSTRIELIIILPGGNVNVIGTDDAETIIGNAEINVINGSAGHDRIDAAFGSDIVRGGAGGDEFLATSKIGDIDRYLYGVGDIQAGFIDTYRGILDSDDFLDLSVFISAALGADLNRDGIKDAELDRIDDFIDIQAHNASNDVNANGFDLILHMAGGYSTSSEIITFATFLDMSAATGVIFKVFGGNGVEIDSELIKIFV